MANPWESIPLSDYECHMSLASVRQLQAMNALMKGQLSAWPVSSVMLLGVAGGNGLEHIPKDRVRKAWGVDVNPAYLEAAAGRHPELAEVLECLCTDLTAEPLDLPQADLVIANLLVEYIGLPCFQRVLRQVRPRYVSCVIQLNLPGGWVSDSPYLHAFDCLEPIHCQMDPEALTEALREAGYSPLRSLEAPLPNGKKLMELDFRRQNQERPCTI